MIARTVRGGVVLGLATLTLLALPGGATEGEEVVAPVDVSGRRGADGADGRDGSSSGADGDDAGPSSPGQHAGSLDLTVAPAVDGRGFVVRGTSTLAFDHGAPRGAPRPARAVERAQALGQVVPLLARGGDGGHGGDGGDGATGWTGSRGSDATCHSSGGSGGRGGDGGDGGDATSGSDGGAGGDVTVRVAGRDTHLLLLVEPDNQGGRGGAPGRNGRGGAGGAGGAGGRSHSSHGTSNNRCSGRSGGSSGSPGSSGSDGSAPVARGDDGPPGRLVYVVDGVEYPDRYRLELAGFEVVSANDDGVFEPGEEVVVRRVAARNAGGVPTPPQELHETRVYLPLTRNVTAPSAPILLPVSLAAGRSAVLPDALRFSIPDVDVDAAVVPNVRYADEGVVDPRAHVADARRDHPEFVNPTRFPVGFPVVLRPVSFGSAMGAGETRRIVLEVENVSTRPFGRAVEAWQAAHGQPFDPALRRGIHVTFGFEGRTLAADDLVLVDPQGQTVDLARGVFTWQIDALGPGEVARCEVSLGLRPEAAAYAGGELAVDLHLGRLGRPEDDRRVVERRRLPVRVAARWEKPARPSLLLVTNVGVEQEVVGAWRALAEGLGYGLAIWDLSYYGFLPLGARREGRADALLMDDVPGQVAIVLGNAFESPLVDEAGVPALAEAASFLAPEEVVRAASRSGLRTFVVGQGLARDDALALHTQLPELRDWRYRASWDETLSVAEVTSFALGVAAVTSVSVHDLVLPTAEPARVVEHASAGDLVAALTSDAADVHDPDVVHRVPLTEGWFYGAPRSYRVSTMAHRLVEELAARWPDRRYLAVTRHDPALEDGALWNTIRHGFAELRRLPTDAVDALEVPPERLGRADYVREGQLLEAVLKALPFERKLELLEAYLGGQLPLAPGSGAPMVTVEGLGEALATAVVTDLAGELRVWIRDRWSGLATSGRYRERLARHAALARLSLTEPLAPDEGDPRAACALRIAAAVECMARRAWDVTDVVVPLGAQRYYVAAAVAGTLGDGLVDDFLRAVFGEDVDLDDDDEALSRRAGELAWIYSGFQSPREGEWSRRRAYDVHLATGNVVWTTRELALQRAIEAARAERRAAFLEALDRLRIRTELSEGLAPAPGGR